MSYPHVEHKLPKAHRPDLVVSWTNLTLACPVCNIEKLDYYDPNAPLLDPYLDVVADHVIFRGPAIASVLGSEVGGRTIKRLKLMRPALFAERMKRIESLHELLEKWATAAGSDKDLFADVVRQFCSADREFSECLRQYAESHNFNV